MDELTTQEIDTLIDALDAWVTADRNRAMLTGLLIGALVAKVGDKETGAAALEKIMSGESEKQQNREEIAIVMKAKLLKMRDHLIAKEISESIS